MEPRSLDDALNDVGSVLVYDPTTRQLCLRSSSPFRKNSDTDSGLSGSSSKDISVSSISSHDIPDEDDIPDLELGPVQNNNNNNNNNKSSKLLSNLILKLSPALSREKEISLSISAGNDDCDPLKVSLQQRPPNLPPKSVEELNKHKCQFAEIVKSSKKRQAKECTMQRKNHLERLKLEDQVSTSISVWNNQILPSWPECLSWKRTKELWSNGVPGPVRSQLWQLAIGNELNITEELYHISLARSKITVWLDCDLAELTNKINNLTFKHESISHSHDSSNESVAFQIKLDVSRTFAHLGLFQESGPYHEDLVNILAAYSVCRPDLGYSQGMSFLAAMLLLNLDKPETVFIAFSNLINRHPFQAFYRLNRDKMEQVYANYTSQLQYNHPKLYQHFVAISMKPEYYLVEQIYTLFSRSLPLESACRIWDLYLLEGEPLLYRASLALLTYHSERLLEMDFAEIAQLLTNQMTNFDSAKYFQILSQTKLSTLCKHQQ